VFSTTVLFLAVHAGTERVGEAPKTLLVEGEECDICWLEVVADAIPDQLVIIIWGAEHSISPALH